MEMNLLSTAYLGPVYYYRKLVEYPVVAIELYEHFKKQTYRSRCEIYGANGRLTLSIPLEKHREKTITKDIRISSNAPWQKIHWRSIEAAYRSSPYFEYFEDDIRPFYEMKADFLVDFNQALQEKMLSLLKLNTTVHYTDSYEKQPLAIDWRNAISPKLDINRASETLKPYMQVFEPRHGFISNLSVLDLLLNEGVRGAQLLK